jgi:hypothetical protein
VQLDQLQRVRSRKPSTHPREKMLALTARSAAKARQFPLPAVSEPVEKADGDESTGRREMRQRASRERRRGGVQAGS